MNEEHCHFSGPVPGELAPHKAGKTLCKPHAHDYSTPAYGRRYSDRDNSSMTGVDASACKSSATMTFLTIATTPSTHFVPATIQLEHRHMLLIMVDLP